MNRKELSEKISKEIGISKKAAMLFLKSTEHIIAKEIAVGGIARIKGFGAFKKVVRKGRAIKFKGETIVTDDKYAVKFIPYKDLRNDLRKPKPGNDGSNAGEKNPNGSGSGSRPITSTTANTTNEEGELIVGPRMPTNPLSNIPESKYIGQTKHGEPFHQISEWEYYPNIYIPAQKTEILSAVKSNRQTKGVAEGKFRGIIQQAVSCVPEIEVQDNMCISITGTSQCYYPDFVLSWTQEHIYIDIEIDEKYDIESGVPIHFIGSRDEERDVYLVEQGWCVLRISEEDVIRYPKELVQAIKHYLYGISRDVRFEPIQQQIHKEVKRWTDDEAKQAADEHFRENLLGLPTKSYKKKAETSQSGKDPKIAPFFPEKYTKLEEQIRAAQKFQYVIVAVFPNGGEYALKSNSIKIIKDKSCKLSGYDTIEEKEFTIPFYKIYKVNGRNDIIGERIGSSSLDRIQQCRDTAKAIKIAKLSCNPVKFNYTNGQGENSDRTVVHLSYWFEIMNDKTLTMKETLFRSSLWLYENDINEPINGSSTYFSGYCLKHKEHKTFRTDRINNLIVYNIYKPHPKVAYGTCESNDIWDCLEKRKLNIVEYILKTIPPFISEHPLNIGNKCNYLIMKGELDEAYEKIISFSPDFFVKEASKKWKDIVLNDCEHFIESDNHADNFKEMKNRLEAKWK